MGTVARPCGSHWGVVHAVCSRLAGRGRPSGGVRYPCRSGRTGSRAPPLPSSLAWGSPRRYECTGERNPVSSAVLRTCRMRASHGALPTASRPSWPSSFVLLFRSLAQPGPKKAAGSQRVLLLVSAFQSRTLWIAARRFGASRASRSRPSARPCAALSPLVT